MKKQNNKGIEYYSYPNMYELQQLQLSLLKIIDGICRDNNIFYWIDGGSLLGSVRHQGFIPWDDDLDICLLKPDYDKLLPLLSHECNNNDSLFLKYAGNSKLVSHLDYLCSSEMIVQEPNGTTSPCHIDIFPMKLIENLKESKLEDKTYSDIAYYFINGHYRHIKPIDKYKCANINQALNAKNKYFDFYNNTFMKKGFREDDYTNRLVGYCFGSILRKEELDYFHYNDIFPLKEIEFEGVKVFSPNNPNAYLKKLYGDFMQLPRIDQRVPYNISSSIVMANNRLKVQKDYAKKAKVFNLTFYFLQKKYGKIRLVCYYMIKLGVIPTIKGLKVTNRIKQLLKQPTFKRVYIDPKQ